MNTHTLSKSSFLRGNQCTKALYLHLHHKRMGIERDPLDEGTASIFSTGTDVGILAQKLFPGGVDASPEHYREFDKSVIKTHELIAAGEKIIYEAAFEHQGVVAAIDILVKKGDKWKAYEVKSSSWVKEVYELDAAIQYWVITGSGLPLDDIYIVHLNTSYVRNGRLDLEKLFNKVSVKDIVLELQIGLEAQVNNFKQILGQDNAPKKDIGKHCSSPYDCDFRGHCWKHIPENSVFDISRMRQDKKFELYNEGIVRFEDIPSDLQMSEKQWMQVEGVLKNKNHIDKPALKQFLKNLSYPLHFIDFETFMPAIPMFPNSRPYQQLCFQYSAHTLDKPGGQLKHKAFLAEANGDPRLEFLKSLLEDTLGKGSILVYNKSFEATRLKELARDFPGYKRPITNRIRRMKDLAIPFQKGHYYVPSMNGSYSIKNVLPALVDNLSYKELGIQNGGVASSAFFNLYEEKDRSVSKKTRSDLLEYCKMDTLAMVKVLEVLQY